MEWPQALEILAGVCGSTQTTLANHEIMQAALNAVRDQCMAVDAARLPGRVSVDEPGNAST
jgi:hypothetical protein